MCRNVNGHINLIMLAARTVSLSTRKLSQFGNRAKGLDSAYQAGGAVELRTMSSGSMVP